MMKKIICTLTAITLVIGSVVLFPGKAFADKKTELKCDPAYNGTFIQAWLCDWWTDEEWKSEIQYMKEAGIDYLILQSLVTFDGNYIPEVHYDTEISSLKEYSLGCNTLENCLKNCQQEGIKVFVGLANFENWWVFAGITSEYIKTCNLMAQMEEEIFERYKKLYPDALYGWYFVPEINNIITMRLSIGNIAKGFNIFINKAKELDNSMPVLMSPYYTEYLTIPSLKNAERMWKKFFDKAEFLEGDIFSPQDAVGAAWTKEEHLESVWQMYSRVVDRCGKKIHLWANCENMTVARGNIPIIMPPATIEKVNSTRTLDKFVYQMKTAAKYCENIIVFSYNHYHSPNAVTDSWQEAYIKYLSNDYTIDNVVVLKPDNQKVEDGVFTFDKSQCKYVVYYIILENGKEVSRIEADDELKYPAVSGRNYSVYAVDAFGNKSAY